MRAGAAALAALVAACAGHVTGGATASGASTSAAAAHRAWWNALVLADTAALRRASAPTLSATMSSGRTFALAGMLDEAASHTAGSRLAIEWGAEDVRLLGATAVVTSRVTESDGPAASTYRYLTVLERSGSDWRVVAAQSTRELAFTPRVSTTVTGPLADYAGTYRTPRGGALRVAVRDSGLMLVEPSGTELPMAPIGPGLFEFVVLSPSNGVVRFAFARDSVGRVASFTRLVSGSVLTFPRVP